MSEVPNVSLEQLELQFKSWEPRLAPREVRIIGGEPLLHPNIDEILSLYRQYWTEPDIFLVTNGSLLNRMSKQFFELLLKNNIILKISLHHPAWKERLDRACSTIESPVVVCDYTRDGSFSKAYSVENNSLVLFSSDAKASHKACYLKRNCHELIDNKLYHCSLLAYWRKAHEYGIISDNRVLNYQPGLPEMSDQELKSWWNDDFSSVCSVCPQERICMPMSEKWDDFHQIDKIYLTDTNKKKKMSKQYKSAVGIVTCNSAKYIQEACCFHHITGFERIILVLDRIDDSTYDAIMKLPEEVMCKVDVMNNYSIEHKHPYNNNDPIRSGFQYRGYQKIYDFYHDKVEWLAFFDDDEYIYDSRKRKINEILDALPPEATQMAIPWLKFGTNKRTLSIKHDETRLAALTKRSNYDEVEVKVIAKMDSIVMGQLPHKWYWCHSTNAGDIVDPYGAPAPMVNGGGFDFPVPVRMNVENYSFDIALVHYIFGTLEDFVIKCRIWEREHGDINKWHGINVMANGANAANQAYDDTRMSIYTEELVELLKKCKT
jgi:organic radical activating enzyme